MSYNYYELKISVPTQNEAKLITQKLLEKKLIACGKISSENSMYWWKDKIYDEDYFNILAYTIEAKKDEIITYIKKIHSDEVPAITFTKIEFANTDFLEWIKETTK